MEKTIKLIAPAKVNLFLAVGKKERASKFHPVLNVLHTLILHDVLYITYKPANKTSINVELVQGEDPDVFVPDVKSEDNIAYKAIKKLSEFSKKNYDISVIIEKNIPHQAGLAGGSTDGAAALLGASKIFNIDEDKVLEVAKSIGSDVPFFLQGGCALYTGAGEIFDHKIQPINREIVIVKPREDMGLSTAKVYSTFDDMPIAQSSLTEQYEYDEHKHKTSLTEVAKDLNVADNIPLFNNLAFASEKLNPELVKIKKWLIGKTSEDKVLLCGSGSATFAICDEADKIVKEATSYGWWACSTSLANVKVRIVPTVTEI